MSQANRRDRPGFRAKVMRHPTLLGFIGFALVVAVWVVVTDLLRLFSPTVLPGPGEVADSMWRLTTTGPTFDEEQFGYRRNLIGHVLVSAQRVWIGFLVATVIAVPLGIAMAFSDTVHDMVDTIVQLLRPIPPIAWTPLVILWFGAGATAVTFIISLGALWPGILSTVAGVRRVRHGEVTLLRAGESLGASKLQQVALVVLPASMPYVFTGLRLGFGLAWWMLIPAEMIASRSGLGFVIVRARASGITADVIAGILAIGLVGLVFAMLFRALGRWRVFQIERAG